jgi:hypothetical protein
MKSAYELAMERLEKASPSISLTEDQKKKSQKSILFIGRRSPREKSS